MKLTSKQRRFADTLVAATTAVLLSSCGAPPAADVDVWIGAGARPVQLRARAADAACVSRGDARDGWEARLEGREGAAVRSVDVAVPHISPSGSRQFYLGLSIAGPRSMEQVTIDTRADAARHSGEGRAWAEASDSMVRMTVIAHLADSSWYLIELRCRPPAARGRF